MRASRSDVTEAIHWWCADPKNPNIDPSAPALLGFLFTVLEALHIQLQRVPASWDAERNMGIASAGTRGAYLGISGGDEYLLMRSILALVTDIENIADALATAVSAEPLHFHAERIAEATEPFRDARNFFTHLDERLVNRDKHGITGSATTDCGIEYRDGATGVFHLVLSKGGVHFSDHGLPKAVGLMPRDFKMLYSAGNDLFTMLARHSVHPRHYPQPLLTLPRPT
jgi:hypothetical protein